MRRPPWLSEAVIIESYYNRLLERSLAWQNDFCHMANASANVNPTLPILAGFHTQLHGITEGILELLIACTALGF